MNSTQKQLYIIDGHALVYRAYYAFINNPLRTTDGQNVSAIFGFARMLLNLIRDEKPHYLAVAFDPPKKSFRFDLYKEYKANRAKMPDDLKSQVEEIKAMVDMLGIQRLENSEVEADDILGSAAKTFASSDVKVMLVTGDKDAYQLVNDNVHIYANKKGITDFVLYDPEAVQEKLGISVDQVIDYMALMGDTADNIPGVKGIGEKSAQKLISQFGSLDSIYENIDQLKGKQKTLLEEGREGAYLSRQLVTIRQDVPLDVTLDDLTCQLKKDETIAEYFNSLEMSTLAQEFFPSDKTHAGQEIEKRYETVTESGRLSQVVNLLIEKGITAIDTETTSVSPNNAQLIGVSLSHEPGSGWYIPLHRGGLFGGEGFSLEEGVKLLRPLVENSKVKKVGQNIKYDIIVFKRAGLEMKGVFFDTMVASYVLNTEERRHNMDELAMRYLNYKTISFKELVGTGKNALPITEVPLEKLSEYASEDADITWRLYELFSQKLKEEKLEELFFSVEMPLVEVLAQMEYNGVAIDPEHFQMLASVNNEKLLHVQQAIFHSAEIEFNINSTRELSEILFERLGMKPVKKTKTGYSTDISVLEALKDEHPIVPNLIEYRTLSKLKNTYIDTLPKLILEHTGRIHTSYNQTVVATGRLSSSDPNLQNIPVKNDFGRSIRKGFIAQEGYKILAADYSQIELRLAAHLSQDANMMRAFSEKSDIHSLTASRVFGVSMEEVEPHMRRQAKIINFATIYGVSPWGLSQQAEIGVKEAEEFIRIYFETYPGFQEYIDRTTAFGREHGYVETIMGRRRHIAELDSKNPFRREGAERMAINTPIQGTSADMIKIAMMNIHGEFLQREYKSRMIMQVHDELVFEVHEDETEDVMASVKKNMEEALELTVPIVVDMGLADNWEEAH